MSFMAASGEVNLDSVIPNATGIVFRNFEFSFIPCGLTYVLTKSNIITHAFPILCIGSHWIRLVLVGVDVTALHISNGYLCRS